MFMVTAVFAAVTIGTMLTVVTLRRKGVKLLDFSSMQRYSHAIIEQFVLQLAEL
jgi:hypothetical protein